MLSNPRPEPDEHTMGELVAVLTPIAMLLSRWAAASSMIAAAAGACCGQAQHGHLHSAIHGWLCQQFFFHDPDRVKVSLYNACPDAILADTRIWSMRLSACCAGFGDMIAGIVGMRMAFPHLINASIIARILLIWYALRSKVVDAAPGLKARDPKVGSHGGRADLSGIAMSFARYRAQPRGWSIISATCGK